MRADLAHLAHRCCDIDKYREETCVVIGKAYYMKHLMLFKEIVDI